MIFENQKFSKIFGSLRNFFLLYNTQKTEQNVFLEKKFFVPEKKILSLKKTLKKKFVSGTHRGGFQCIMILTP